MILAFCLYKYFLFGGLQRDFIKIAYESYRRGIRIRVYTLSWQGDVPDYIELVLVPVTAWQNHTRYRKYSAWVSTHLEKNQVDSVIGFNKMPHLDIYYAADPCYMAKIDMERQWIYPYLRRTHHLLHYENSVFSTKAKTHILSISQAQKKLFQHYYKTPDHRWHDLPPSISQDRQRPVNANELRALCRQTFDITSDDILLLMVGSGFKTKGVDRSLFALAALPKKLKQRTRLIIIGQDNPKPFIKLIKKLALESNVTILSGREDIVSFLLGADLLLHPAYRENTGTILLEAIVAGLPILASDVCGYAHLVVDAQAGELIQSPFSQNAFNRQLLNCIMNINQRKQWSNNALAFGEQKDIFNKQEQIVDTILAIINSA